MGFNISSFNQQLFAYSVSSGVTPTPPGPSQEHDIEGFASASFDLTYNNNITVTITPVANNKWYYDFPSGTTLTSFRNMFYWARGHMYSVSFKNTLDTSNVTDMSGMFSYCAELDTVNLSYLDTSNVTTMEGMFEGSYLLSADLSNFNTSKVTNMSKMFNWCERLSSVNLSSFDTSKVTNMSDMFAYCKILTTADLSNFDTSKVTNMSHMFDNCNALSTFDLTSFDTSSVTDMSYMFNWCQSVRTLDLSSFKTTQVNSYNYMFNRNHSSLSVYYVPANWNSSIVSAFPNVHWVAV